MLTDAALLDALRVVPPDAAPAVLYERVVAGNIDAEALTWLVTAFRLYDRFEGKLPLERCLRLPTAAQRRLAERDLWLRSIAELVDEPRPVVRAHEVERLLRVFITRGHWREWRDLPAPPAEATPLQMALFFAAGAVGSRPPPRWRQILRVISVATESGCDDNGRRVGLEL